MIDFAVYLFLLYVFCITYEIFLFLLVKILTEECLIMKVVILSCCTEYPLNQVYM